MKKIRSKHIVEYITCWLDSSVGSFNYLFNDNKITKAKNDEDTDEIFFSSKNNSKVAENSFKALMPNDCIKNDHYIKQLYTKEYSDDECTTNKKKKININSKFYKKKRRK